MANGPQDQVQFLPQRPATTRASDVAGAWLLLVRQTAQRLTPALGLLSLMALPGGCSDHAAPKLSFSSVRRLSMPAEKGRIPAPRGLAMSGRRELYVLDTAARILVLDETGDLLRQWRMPEAEVGTPEDLTLMNNGLIAVPDTHYHRIVFFNEIGTVVRMLGRHGTALGEFIYPVSLAEDDAGNFFVCEYGSNDRVQKFSADGTPVLSFGSFGTQPGQFQRPSGMVWHAGRLYVADAANQRVQVFTDDGDYVGLLGSADGLPELVFPYDIDMGPGEALFVVEWGAGRVTRMDLTGRVTGRFGTPGDGPMQLTTPWGVACDASGAVHIADTGNRRIVELTP